jgi:VIT1/CCC1 family predicted Fe2+/Mn2+ transporter
MTLAALIALALCFIGIVTFIIGMYLVLGPVALIVSGALLLTVGATGVDVTPSSPRRRMGRKQ